MTLSLVAGVVITSHTKKMKGGSRLRMVVVVLMVVGMAIGGQSSAADSFRDCYAKCFLFCMIEPSQTLCSCTTQCLKECIFPTPFSSSSTSKNMNSHLHQEESFGFCKLGCASSFCSNISTKLNPNGKNMESCVGSCSKKCTMGY